MKLGTVLRLVRTPVRAGRLGIQRLYELTHPDEPWISPRAIRFCDRTLHRGMAALEWGSGRSTRWFADRVGTLTSVEHDQAWHGIVSSRLSGVANVEYLYIPLDHPADEPTSPIYATTPRYVAVADRMADESLDFVVVDGHYRQACVRAVLSKIRAGGFLLIDNSDWLSRQEWGVSERFELAHQSSYGRGQTSVWRKLPIGL